MDDLARLDRKIQRFSRDMPFRFNLTVIAIAVALFLLGEWLMKVLRPIGG